MIYIVFIIFILFLYGCILLIFCAKFRTPQIREHSETKKTKATRRWPLDYATVITPLVLYIEMMPSKVKVALSPRLGHSMVTLCVLP